MSRYLEVDNVLSLARVAFDLDVHVRKKHKLVHKIWSQKI